MSFLSKDQYNFLELSENESGEVQLITYTFSQKDDGTANIEQISSEPGSNAPDYSELLIAKNLVEYYEAATILKQTKEELVEYPKSPKLLHHKKFLDEVTKKYDTYDNDKRDLKIAKTKQTFLGL